MKPSGRNLSLQTISLPQSEPWSSWNIFFFRFQEENLNPVEMSRLIRKWWKNTEQVFHVIKTCRVTCNLEWDILHKIKRAYQLVEQYYYLGRLMIHSNAMVPEVGMEDALTRPNQESMRLLLNNKQSTIKELLLEISARTLRIYPKCFVWESSTLSDVLQAH